MAKEQKEKPCCQNCVNFFEANAFNWPEYDCLKSGKDILYHLLTDQMAKAELKGSDKQLN